MAEFLELLDALRATRDADSCLRGLNLFRKGLRGQDGPAFLARYLRQSPDWQELQSVWDTQLTVQHYHVTVTLLLALADALRTATHAATDSSLDAAARAALAGGAAGLAGAVLHRRLKALYFCLSSDMRGKSNAALALLAAVAAALAASDGGALPAAAAGAAAAPAASLRDLVRAFDWSLSALPGLSRPPREKKGEGAADLRRRYWQQWALGDPLKRPTRALFSELALGLLRHAGGDALLAQQLLQLRPLVGGLLHHLAADPPGQQLKVLQVLQRRVLSAKAGVPAAVQAEVFSDAALQQLASIAATAAVEGQEGEAEEAGAGDAGQQRAEQVAAAAAALAVLEAVASQPAHGLAAAPDSPQQQQFVLAGTGSHQLQPGQRRLLRLLLRLRPADSAAHLQLLLAAAASDAPLAAALLLALPYSLEPAAAGAAASGSAAAGRWFAHAAVAAHLLQLLPGAAPSGLLTLARAAGAAPPPGGRRAQALLRCCFPPCLQRAALSRGLQHSNSLVRYGTLGLLVSAMSALEAVLQDCTAAAGAVAGAAQAGQAAEAREGWLALRRWLQQAARQQLPDPTLLLALLSAAEKEGWEAANELQLTAVLRLLLLWQRLLPAALAEANVDAERLLPTQPLALRPHHQLLLLELLQAAADATLEAAANSAGGEGGAAAAVATAAVPAAASAASLLPPLRLLAGAQHAAVRTAARRWLLQRLLATAAFEGNGEEAVLWLDLLPRGSEVVCSFLVEAIQMLLRRPHELFEQQQELLAAAPAAAAPPAGAPSGRQQFSLLAPCALRQLLRVLGSAKMCSADKAAVAAYVAAVLRHLLEQQLGRGGAALAAVLLGVARQEAARQQQQQAGKAGAAAGSIDGEQDRKETKKEKDKKRKATDGGGGGCTAGSDGVLSAPLALPAEGQPLLGLLAVLERQLSPTALPAMENGSEESQPAKKAKKGRQSAAGETGAAAPVAVLSGGGGSADGESQLEAADVLPAGESQLEPRLIELLDGPVGDAVAALPSAQRRSAAFTELATAAAGSLGTAVLRHRLAPAASPGDADDAAAAMAAAASGVAAMCALRRFMAALLPDDEEEEAAEGAGGNGAGSESGGSESDSDSSSSGESNGDEPMPGQAAGVRNPAVAEAALQLLQRLLGHSRFLPAMRAAAASPPPLPPAAEAAARPLASLLPLAAAADAPAGPAGPILAADMKKELCELIETLLDLHQQYGSSDDPRGGTAGSAAAQQAQQVAAAEAALLPLLMAGYGASCSPTDAAVWSLAAAINQRQWQREQRERRLHAQADAGAAAADEVAAEGDADTAALASLLHGPLARNSFAWGAAAAALQQLPPVDAADSSDAAEAQRAHRRLLLQQRLPLDPVRAALTACHWPEAGSLAAPGSSSQQSDSNSSGGSSSSGSGGQPAQLPGCAAAYDPGFLLPFCCCCLQHQLLAPRAFAEAGLLSVCLRGLASADAGCRAAAYQALALFEAQLTAAAAPDFREKQQLSVLLSTLSATITRPFQRLPAVHAVFLAEAALLALHPGAAMYPAVNKQVTRRATLATSDMPLLGQLLMSGGQQHAAERRWMLQLLLAGLRSSDDAALYRRKHAFEQAMALHDSCVADPAVASLALRLLCTATHVPRAARQLAHESGLVLWLAGAAQAAIERLTQQHGSDGSSQGAGGDAGEALRAPLAALRRLLQLRAVMRGAGGAGAAQQMLAAAQQLAGAAAAAVGTGSGARGDSSPAAVQVCHHVLPFLQAVQQQLESSSVQGQPGSSKRLPGGAESLEGIMTAVQALTAVSDAAVA
ncbi:hypothetical protein ABPG75_000462 [Micractinium tetrahymenae]